MLTLNTFALFDPSEDSNKPENNSEEPIGIGIFIDFIPYSHEEALRVERLFRHNYK